MAHQKSLDHLDEEPPAADEGRQDLDDPLFSQVAEEGPNSGIHAVHIPRNAPIRISHPP